ncbi:MAG: hypothetical protein JWM73_3042, partial [Solirubrobacterales bacterium]|nr:hypothetical protein [Solirubrobacterales bacterium]
KVSSYYIEPAATVIDPMEPEDGFGWFDGRNLDRVVLTNRHHYRQSDRFHARFDIPVLVVEQGLHEVEGRPGVRAFAFGDEVAPGITAHAIEPSWPDEGALHIALGPGLVAIADGAMHDGDDIAFVSDEHLGEDPAKVRELLRHGYGRLLTLDFDTLLFAHGAPVVGGGKDALKAFAEGSDEAEAS